MNSHVGKTCPYCRFPIKSGQRVVACDACGQPHHAECWGQGGGCAVYGCVRRPAVPAPGPGAPATIPPGYGVPPPPSPSVGRYESAAMGIVALVLGLVGILIPFCSIGAVICGVIGLTGRRAGRPLACAGLILGLLVPAGYAAILFPVFRKARANAQRASCASSLKQLELGLMMYASDYDGRFPTADRWPTSTFPYLKNASVYVCPSDARSSKQIDTAGATPTSGGIETSYTMNRSIEHARIRRLAAPVETVALYEGATLSGDLTTPAVRHGGGLNVGFADGHVRWYAAGNFPPGGVRSSR